MGYPQFNKITIQLPLPSATMTKSEYKDVYGIDLDTINFPKVTLLVDGINKYPVDEIKIVSDDVLILAGGKILTIGDNGNVSVTTSAYSVENSKPIYWHGIELQQTGTNGNGIFYCHVLNNSSTPFTKSTFIDWLMSYSIKIVVSGNGIIENGSGNIVNAYAIVKEANAQTASIVTSGANGFSVMTNIDLEALFDRAFSDSVNKIN